MAGVALGLDVLALEGVFGIAAMIEGGAFPAFLGMAAFAFGTIAPLMAFVLVVLLVAGIALFFHFYPGVRAGYSALVA